MIRSNHFILLFLLVFGSTALESAAQRLSVLRGFVSDGSTEQVLQGASVVLLSGDRVVYGTATDGDGFFLINRIEADTYRLRISFVGFTAFEETITIRAGETFERAIALEPRPESIEEVVVEARAPGGVTAVAAGLETITPADIDRVPVPGVAGDLAGYLQTVPGVVVQGDRGGQLFVRGGAVDQNLALIDGLPVYMPFHILSFYSAFPDDIVDGASVYTGGFGAKYGTRVSSVIDVRTRNGNKQHLGGSLSLAPFLSGARIEGPLWKNRVSIIAAVRQSFIKEVIPQIFGQRLPYSFGDRFGKIHALIGNSHSISFTVLDTDDRGDIAGTKKTFEGEALSAAITDSTEVSWTNRVYGGTYVYRSGRLPITARITAGRSEMTNKFGPKNSPERRSSIQSTDLAGHFSWLLRQGRINVGVSYRESTFDLLLDDLFQDLTTDRQTLTELDAYAETELRLAGDRLDVIPGVHLYALTDRSKSWVDPRFRVSWYPGGRAGRVQLHGAGGVYRQSVVGLNDERDLGNVFTAWLPSPDDAPVPRAVHAIAGGSVRLAPWITVALEGFYKKYDDLSVPVFSVLPRFTTSLQSADGTARGADVRVDLKDRPFIGESLLDGYLSYSYSKVEYDTGSITYTPGHDRRHQLNALLHASRDEVGVTVQLQIGSGLPFTQSGGFDRWYLLTPDVDVSSEAGIDRIVYRDPFKGRQPTYARMDVWVEKRVDRGRYVSTIRAGALNLFNRDNLFYYDLFTFNRVDQLPFIPSVGFRVELR